MLLVLQPTTAWALERADVVLLSVAASPREADQLEAVTRELLARLELKVELRRVERIDLAEVRRALGPGQRYFARVWIAFAPSGRARLYLEHGASNRVLVREVSGASENSELVREELGHILQTALEGLKAGEAIGAPRDDALEGLEEPRRAPPQSEARSEAPAPPPPWPRRTLLFGPRYELVWLGDRARFEDGPGAVLQAWSPFGLELAAFYRRPLKVAGEQIGVRLQTLSLRALLTIQARLRQRDGIRLGAGLGADLVRVSPFTTPGHDVQLAESAWRKLAIARLQASYARRVTSFMALELTLGCDLDLSDTRYVFRSGSGELDVLEPWPVRPLLSLGATVP